MQAWIGSGSGIVTIMSGCAAAVAGGRLASVHGVMAAVVPVEQI